MISFSSHPMARRLVIIILVLPVTCLSFYTSFTIRQRTNIPTSYLQTQRATLYENTYELKSIENDTEKVKIENEKWDNSIGILLSSSADTSELEHLMQESPELPQNNDKLIARTILIIVSAFYGTNFGCVKILNENLDPSVAAALRFSLAGLVFLPYLLKIIKTKPQLVRGGLEVGAYNAFGYWTQATSLISTPASTVAFICSLAVIVVPILGTIFPEDKKENEPWYAPLLPALVATAGVGCLELGGSNLPGIGDLWALGQPLFFGLGFWRIETFMKESREPGDAQAFTGAMMISVATGAWLWTLSSFILPHLNDNSLATALVHERLALNDWHVLAAIGWTGIVTTALTAYGENYAMKSLSASESTVIYSTEPLWGTAFAAAALGETVGVNTLVGAALILSACVWSTVGPAISVAGALATAQVAMGEGLAGFAEVLENVHINWSELIGRASER